MSDLKKPTDAFWYGYALHSTPVEHILDHMPDNADDITVTTRALQELARLAFTAGARWELRESARLSPHIAKFLEMVVLLGPDYPYDQWLSEVQTDSTVTEGDYHNAGLEDIPF